MQFLVPANTGHSPKAASMLTHRLRRWPDIETALGECPVFAGIALEQFTSYLSDRCQQVKIQDYISDAVYISFGVPQALSLDLYFLPSILLPSVRSLLGMLKNIISIRFYPVEEHHLYPVLKL